MIVIGNGVVVDPKVLLAEIDGLAERGWTCPGCGSPATRT